MFNFKALIAGLAIATAGSAVPASAHHSFAMFSDESMEVQGVVQEFKFTNPHTFILLEVTDENGEVTTWNLEGSSPSGLSRRGWSSQALQSGDEVIISINPLRSGAPGGSWDTGTITYADGTPVVDR